MKMIDEPVKLSVVKKAAAATFGEMVKAVVDVERRKLVIGGGMHVDAEEILLKDGSKQQDLWGFNIYPGLAKKDWLEYDSLINIRPKQNNRSMTIQDKKLRQKIVQIVNELIIDD